MANSQTSGVIKIRNARLSFASIFNPTSFSQGDPEYYKATFLLEPEANAEVIAEIRKAANTIHKAQWPDGARLKGKCFGLADEDDKTYDGWEGMFYVSASRRVAEGRPTIVDRDRTPLSEPDGKPYPGCYVNATVTLWTQDNQYGKRINANLRGIQFVRDGDSFGGGSSVRADDEFDIVEEAVGAGANEESDPF